MPDVVDIGPAADMAAGSQRVVVIAAARLLLCREATGGQHDDRIWAVRDQCPHAFQPLLGGVVQRGTIQCPKHGACFDLATGAPTNEITTRWLPVYPTHIRDGHLFVSTLALQSQTTS